MYNTISHAIRPGSRRAHVDAGDSRTAADRHQHFKGTLGTRCGLGFDLLARTAHGGGGNRNRDVGYRWSDKAGYLDNDACGFTVTAPQFDRAGVMQRRTAGCGMGRQDYLTNDRPRPFLRQHCASRQYPDANGDFLHGASSAVIDDFLGGFQLGSIFSFPVLQTLVTGVS